MAVVRALGITLPERQLLARRFGPGQDLWRMTLNYFAFAPRDANWPGRRKTRS